MTCICHLLCGIGPCGIGPKLKCLLPVHHWCCELASYFLHCFWPSWKWLSMQILQLLDRVCPPPISSAPVTLQLLYNKDLSFNHSAWVDTWTAFDQNPTSCSCTKVLLATLFSPIIRAENLRIQNIVVCIVVIAITCITCFARILMDMATNIHAGLIEAVMLNKSGDCSLFIIDCLLPIATPKTSEGPLNAGFEAMLYYNPDGIVFLSPCSILVDRVVSHNHCQGPCWVSC